MKRLIATIFVLCLVSGATLGCATLTQSPRERIHEAHRTANYDAMLFNEDLDYFLLQDHPSRLSTWILR